MAIRCVVVTPERTELDIEATYITLPMYDGELGVATGRAAMIGRLGYGVLKLETETGTQRIFVDGGFAQVENNEVSVLTGRAIRTSELDIANADAQLAAALELPSNSAEKNMLKQTAVMRARGMRRAARK
jgi:F-type H+-transporting ATPase subunit epsilon